MQNQTKIFDQLHEISRKWSALKRPAGLPDDIPVKQLPRPLFEGDNSYNGFLADERRKTEQVMKVLRRRGYLETGGCCSLCGSTTRIGFHNEDYFDPFSAISICGPCHFSLHLRFKHPERWHERLDRYSSSPFISDFRLLPMEPMDFATWLRQNTDGPHDAVKRIWPHREIPDYKPRKKKPSGAALRFVDAILKAKPTETERRLLTVLKDNPGADSAQLTKLSGWKGTSAWHLRFGLFCKKLEADLGPVPTTMDRSDEHGEPSKFYIGLLANFDETTRGFTMHNDAIDAIAHLQKSEPGFTLSDQ